MINRKSGKLGMLAIGLATVAGTSLMTGPSAAAADECQAGEFCLYENSDGGQIQRIVNQGDGDCIRATMVLADGSLHQARKITNRTSVRAAAFQNNDCSGKAAGTVLPGATSYSEGGPLSFRLFDCESGKICFWESEGFGGTKTVHEWSNVCTDTGIDANSVWNRGNAGVTLYQGSWCLGANVVSDAWGYSEPYALSKTVRRFKVM